MRFLERSPRGLSSGFGAICNRFKTAVTSLEVQAPPESEIKCSGAP